MALTETPALPYELLFRFDEVTGQLKGAHFMTITSILKDGVPIASTPSEAMPVSIGAGVAGLDLAPILGQLATGLQAQVDTLTQQLADVTIERDRYKVFADNAAVEVAAGSQTEQAPNQGSIAAEPGQPAP